MLKLKDPVGNIPYVGPVYVRRLEKLGIKTVEDLIYHAPFRYLDYSLISDINRAQIGELVTVKGTVTFIKNQYTKSKKKIQISEITDKTGKINVIWFNQPYLIQAIRAGTELSLSGEIGWFGRKKTLVSPDYEKVDVNKAGVHTGRFIPVYHETYGVSSKWLRSRITNTYPVISDQIEEYLPDSTLEELKMIGLKKAINTIHYPDSQSKADEARRRLAFNELLFLQLASQYKDLDWKKRKAVHKLRFENKEVSKFISSLPFELTSSQTRSIDEILDDLKKPTPMNRLLEGDVGSGKTVVAAAAAFASFINGYQTIFMAPTQILAQQHFNTLKSIFSQFKIKIALVTSAGIEKEAGKIDIFVGTHALIHKKVVFNKVSVVVIDEQHRFGVEQRAHLTKTIGGKLSAPHILTMTATPIPRTIALTVYGDLDLSTIDELPKGRVPIKTWLVPPKKRNNAYKWIGEQIKRDQIQAFVVCPLIDESDSETMIQVKAATTEATKLKKIFKNYKVGLLHGRQKIKEKKDIISSFENKKIDILVSTPVVEVGIDIPNATIMLIEAAERFGLAQLHQLRGRVGRGEKESYCLLFTESKSQKVDTRLKALQKSLSGFALAELDLKLRGPGEIFGKRQSGFSELKIATWQDTDLIKRSKDLAEEVVTNPKKFTKLLKKLKSTQVSPN